MKVSELIKRLKKLNQDALVVHRGYEDGYDPADENGPEECIVYPQKNTAWYNGKYEKIGDPIESAKESEYIKEHFDLEKPTLVVII